MAEGRELARSDRGRREDGAMNADPAPTGMERADGFLVVERTYSSDSSMPSVGLANIHAVVPGIEENKKKIERACRVFKERGVNFAVFPEFCLSGYFWEDEPACWEYMEQAVTERHLDWIDGRLRPLLDDTFRVIVMNNIARGEGRRFRNTTFLIADEVTDPLAPEWSYDKVFLPGIEKVYTDSGLDDRLLVPSRDDVKFGFTTCYDYLFTDLLREYAVVDEVDAVVQIASWRAAATRDYPGMNVRTGPLLRRPLGQRPLGIVRHQSDLDDRLQRSRPARDQRGRLLGRLGDLGAFGPEAHSGLPPERGAAHRPQPRHRGSPPPGEGRLRLRLRLLPDLPSDGGRPRLHARDPAAGPLRPTSRVRPVAARRMRTELARPNRPASSGTSSATCSARSLASVLMLMISSRTSRGSSASSSTS